MKTKLALFLNCRFFAPVLLVASLLADSSAWARPLPGDIEQLIQLAEARKLTFLPEFLKERRASCDSLSHHDSQCLQDLRMRAQEVLNCPQSLKRFEEGVQFDNYLASVTFLNGKTEALAPARLQQEFKRLSDHSRKFLPSHFPIVPRIEVYKSQNRNAHAYLNGKILLSSGLWETEPALNEKEIVAVMAHELAHVIELHNMRLNCLYIEWTDPAFSVTQAQVTFLEDLQGSHRSQIWSNLSVSLEFEADQVAALILKRAGYDPLLMAQALKKLLNLDQKGIGFLTQSHPDARARIEAVTKAAE